MSLPIAPKGLDLYALLPAVYRIRDQQLAESLPLLTLDETQVLAELRRLNGPSMPALSSDQQATLAALTARATRGPLQSLLLVIQEQISILADDLDQLYDDQFIETCAPWVIPYIGDLIGYRSVKGIAASIDNPRAEVANTIAFRRRKGTLLVMEELARDATGWGTHAVEFFRVLGDTQYMNHVRVGNHYAPDLRDWRPRLYGSTGFDRTAHKVDVRRVSAPIASSPRIRGRYDVQNIGIFLWSLGAWSVTKTAATPAATNAPGKPACFRFSSLGMDIPLFHRAVAPGFEQDDPHVNRGSRPDNVADRMRRRVLCEDLTQGVGARYYGPDASLLITVDGRPLNPYEIRVCDLAGADGAWANTATIAPYAAAVDPELGRLALPDDATNAAHAVTVSYHYGFNGEIGGGEYARAAESTGSDAFVVTDPARVFPYPDTNGAPRYTDLQGAIDFAIGALDDAGLVAVEIEGSLIDHPAGLLRIDLPAATTLELRAADGSRPTLLLDDEIVVTGDVDSAMRFNGLLIAAAPGTTPAAPSPVALIDAAETRPDGSFSRLGRLELIHSTLVPGWSVSSAGQPLNPDDPVLIAAPAGLKVSIVCSIVGSLRVSRFASLNASDTIIDATGPTGVAYAALDGGGGGSGGGALTLVGCTVIGKVHATLCSLVSDCLFWSWLAAGDAWRAALIAERRQTGCVRFSYLPTGAITPRRFQCVEKAPNLPQPLFAGVTYGLPAYCKLLASTDDRIRRGADDGGEMGAFHYLLNPLRETDMRIRMQEYVPVGMDFGLIFQN